MKVLFLSPWFPLPPFGGALIRVLETLRYLSRRHRVTLLAPVSRPIEAVDRAELDDCSIQVLAVPVSEAFLAVLRRLATGLFRGMPLIEGLHHDRRIAQHIRRLTAVDPFDIIHIEHSFMAPYTAFIDPRSTAKRVLSMHNVESLRFERELEFARGLRRVALLSDRILFDSWEKRALRAFDGIVAVSEVEEAWIREHAPTTAIEIVPNGVNVDYFSTDEPYKSNRSIIFPGLMNYPPNIDAVMWFCDAVLPILTRRYPDLLFRIVGDKPTSQVRALSSRRGVEVTGRVPDVRPYLAQCAAVVVPVRAGAGTRLKILEAMAMRRPVVSTPRGAEGLAVTAKKNILLGETPEALADHVSAVLDNPAFGERLGNAGRRLVETEYDWRHCLKGLENLYETIVNVDGVRDLPVEVLAR
jgi:sugar transferase (PEP-CTERM/EpsH1 system associated)